MERRYWDSYMRKIILDSFHFLFFLLVDRYKWMRSNLDDISGGLQDFTIQILDFFLPESINIVI